MALTDEQKKIIQAAHANDAMLYLLPRSRALNEAEYAACDGLVGSGYAKWLPRHSEMWPGIWLTGKPAPMP